MADCNRNFQSGDNNFLSKISLSNANEKKLQTSRNNLRKKIRKHLSDKGVKSTLFCWQGSYAHKTIITPLDEDFDIDDGVYVDLSSLDKEPTTSTLHSWIKDAVEGHTETPAQDKEPCVRAIFKAGYHVDLPAYKYETDSAGNKLYYLAKKSAGWIESDAKAMTDWYKLKVKSNGEQLRRLTKYLKAWRDFKNSTIKLPSGLTLTILCSEEFVSDPRDDISLVETARKISSRLDRNESIWKPYMPTENMRTYMTDNQFDNFKTKLADLVNKGNKAAYDMESNKKAAEEWQKILGDRFPVYDDDDSYSENSKKHSPVILGGANRKSALG